jgi:hypothetical protein
MVAKKEPPVHLSFVINQTPLVVGSPAWPLGQATPPLPQIEKKSSHHDWIFGL